MSFEFTAKDSLGQGIADMRGREFQMKGPATVNYHCPEIRRVPGTTYFPADAERIEERPLTELQSVTIEDD